MQLQKLARRLRAKHIWQSKVAKHLMVGALLEDATWKTGTPPAREAHFEVNIVKKTLGARSTFGRCNFKKWHTACARSTFRSQNRKNTTCSDKFFKMLLETWHAACARSPFLMLLSFYVAGASESVPECLQRRRRFFDVAKTLHLSHKNDVAANRTFFVAGAQNPDLARCIIDLETDVLRDCRCFLICYLSWQAQGFVCLDVHFSWQAQYFVKQHHENCNSYCNGDVQALEQM